MADVALTPTPDHPVRKGKEREREREAPQPTDIADRMIALKRKQAHVAKTKERQDRPQSSAANNKHHSPRRMLAPPIIQPSIIISQPTPHPAHEPDERDFSRRLKISSPSPRPSHRKAEQSSPRGNGRLYNPHIDPIRRPIVTSEPEAMSEDETGPVQNGGFIPSPRHHPRSQPHRAGGDGPRLFDPHKDNPYQPGAGIIRQGVLPNPNASPPAHMRPTPTPKSSGDWVSASSTSSASYAHSTISSNFTLNSTTTDSSASSAIFSNEPRSEESTASSNALSAKLKTLYRKIMTLEAQLSKESDLSSRDGSEPGVQRIGVLLKSQQSNGIMRRDVKGGADETEKERYRALVNQHKTLAEVVHELLSLTLAPSVPASLKNIPLKYNLPTRLWINAFHRLLETLRHTATAWSPDNGPNIALEHLVSFIYFAYSFYSGLLDEPNLDQFRVLWVESLGDLARYRMAASPLIDLNANNLPSSSTTLGASAITQSVLLGATPSRPLTPDVSAVSDKNASPSPAAPLRIARIDDSPAVSLEPEQPPQPGMAPSVGIIAAKAMHLPPEKEQWRQISREWYTRGLAITPNSGKLHHHLGMLSRDADGDEELRSVYHLVKSMIALHPFTTARETILGLWSSTAQTRRQAPDSGPTDLFVLLHGMIFTNIQLDDFKSVLARFEEKLILEGETVEESEWIMMAIINIGSIFEYGRSNAVLRRVTGIHSREHGPAASPLAGNGKIKLAKKGDVDDKKMDVDDDDAVQAPLPKLMAIHQSPSVSEAVAVHDSDIPQPLKHALQLTFAMFSYVLKNPVRKGISTSALNPYITVLFTFLTIILKDKVAERVLSRVIPWEDLAAFCTRLPRRIMQSELQKDATLLSSGSHPLPEDWCLRGQGWGGKKIYERGFWDRDTNGEEKNLETHILDRKESSEPVDGIIEDEDESDDRNTPAQTPMDTQSRRVRIVRSALKISRMISGFVYAPPAQIGGKGEWRVEGALADKVAKWREQERREKEEEERRLRGTRWEDDDDDMDIDEEDVGNGSGLSDGDEDMSEDVRALKDRLKNLQTMLHASNRPIPSRKRPRAATARAAVSRRLHMVPGYTVLVVDTNILLSSLSMFASLVEGSKWTVVIPLPVIMELDGLASDPSDLGKAATAAASYITSHLRSHSMSLKIQTSRGNYLHNLNVRSEQVDFRASNSVGQLNMDDLILRAAVCQASNWVDRSLLLQSTTTSQDTEGASKVVLLTFDRMLRLKARARDIDAANEQDLAAILARGP